MEGGGRVWPSLGDVARSRQVEELVWGGWEYRWLTSWSSSTPTWPAPLGSHLAPPAPLPPPAWQWRLLGLAAVPFHGLGQPPLPGLQWQQRPFRKGDGNGWWGGSGRPSTVYYQKWRNERASKLRQMTHHICIISYRLAGRLRGMWLWPQKLSPDPCCYQHAGKRQLEWKWHFKRSHSSSSYHCKSRHAF